MWMVSQTDIGRVRLINEDRAAIQRELNGLSLAIVADGMGGHQAGDVASQMAVDLIQEGLKSLHSGMSLESCKQLLRQAVENANENIYEFAAQRENYHGMGTTVVAVIVFGERLLIGHIGDSRVYRMNDTDMVQLTEDHSLVNELVKNGQITLEEANQHPRRNWLTRALGTEPGVEVDIYEYLWNRNDTILLCSDGLSGLVDPRTIHDIVRSTEQLDKAANLLIQAALDAGGDDNVTVVLLKQDNEINEGRGDGG